MASRQIDLTSMIHKTSYALPFFLNIIYPLNPRVIGARSRIRTLEPLTRLPVFKTGAFNRSAKRAYINGDPAENRTRDSTVKGWWLDRLPTGPLKDRHFFIGNLKQSISATDFFY